MSLTNYLMKYLPIQENILLVSRPNIDSSWSDRAIYLEEDYSPHKHYNHRSILLNEVVIEFDEDEIKRNRLLADIVSKRLSSYGFRWTKWYSGNRSTHIHTFIDYGNVTNLRMLKRCFIRFFSNDLGVLPDLQMASNNHLIRAEYGIHEKTGNKKTLISSSGDFPKLVRPPDEVWSLYYTEQKRISSAKLTRDLTDLEAHSGFKYILNSDKFRASDDGRERALFILIHVLKPKYKDKKDELTKFLQEWYRYTSGTKLSEKQIENKVNYHWNRNYNIGTTYINELLESIGRSDLCQ